MNSSSGRYFFGLSEEIFKKYQGKSMYVVFICGDLNKKFVIPASYLEELLRGVATATDGCWKFHIFETKHGAEIRSYR